MVQKSQERVVFSLWEDEKQEVRERYSVLGECQFRKGR